MTEWHTLLPSARETAKVVLAPKLVLHRLVSTDITCSFEFIPTNINHAFGTIRGDSLPAYWS